MDQIAEACRLLADETRLRLLRVLDRAELNVSELTAVLGISQSGVSRHLRLLRDAGLLAERREGSWAYFAPRPSPTGPAARLWESARSLAGAGGDGDLARVEELLRRRRERASSPFDQAEPGERLPVPGRSWVAWSRALLHLLPAIRVADVGCGDGGLALELARFSSEVIAIDRSPAMLERAAARLRAAGAANVTLRRGELEALPLGEQAVDLCVCSQILHHAAQPAAAIAEAARVLRPGGRLLVLDLAPHQEEWVREKLGDQWLGFAPEQLVAMLEAGGFVAVRVEPLPRRRGEAFAVLIASATWSGTGSGPAAAAGPPPAPAVPPAVRDRARDGGTRQ